MQPTNEDIDKAKAQHGGEVWTLRRGAYGFVLRCADGIELRKYTMSVADDRKNVWDAQERLVRHAVVWPASERLAEVLEKRAGLIPWLANEAANIASEIEETEAKKA